MLIKSMRDMTDVLVISDIQAPYGHKDALDFVYEVWMKYVRPTRRQKEIINIGDETDSHSIGDWPSDPDLDNAGPELIKCIQYLSPWYEIFPNVKVCTSNHTDRIFRKAFKHGIPRAYLKNYREFLDAPHGWVWRDYWEIDGIRYEHGHAFSGGTTGDRALIQLPLLNRQSTVFGHFHASAGIRYLQSDTKGQTFGMCVGCLIDPTSRAFLYGKLIKHKPVLGCGLVLAGEPRFISMRLGKGNRWLGPNSLV